MFSKNLLRMLGVAALFVVGFISMFTFVPAMAADEDPITLTLGTPLYIPEENILRVAVLVDKDLAGLNITALQTDIEIEDTSVFTLQNVEMFANTIVHANNIYHNWNTGHDGYVRIDWWNTLPLTGKGILFYIDLTIVGDPGESSRVMLQAFSFFNGGSGDEVEVINRDIAIPQSTFNATGAILYNGEADRPVSFDSLQAVDWMGVHTLDASDGSFEYPSGGGITQFSGSKAQHLCTLQQDAVTAYDAYLLMSCAVGSTECDMEVADVWKDDWLSGFDAGLVAWCGAALQYGFPYSLGTFILDPVAAHVVVVPNEPVTLPVKMVGDLSGNYGESETAMASVVAVEDTSAYTQVLAISSDVGFFTIDFQVAGEADVPSFYEGWTFAENNGRVVGTRLDLVNELTLPISVGAEEISVHLDNHGAKTFSVSVLPLYLEMFLPNVVVNN